jgi:hypothetical protein
VVSLDLYISSIVTIVVVIIVTLLYSSVPDLSLSTAYQVFVQETFLRPLVVYSETQALGPLASLDAMVETLNKPSASISTSASTSTFINYHKAQEDYENSTPSTSRDYESNQAGNLDDDDEIPPIPPPKDIESPRRVSAPTSYSSSSALDQSFGLPDGMDVREALAQCEDPALGWSLQFWATIADPVVSLVWCLTLVSAWRREMVDRSITTACI